MSFKMNHPDYQALHLAEQEEWWRKDKEKNKMPDLDRIQANVNVKRYMENPRNRQLLKDGYALSADVTKVFDTLTEEFLTHQAFKDEKVEKDELFKQQLNGYSQSAAVEELKSLRRQADDDLEAGKHENQATYDDYMAHAKIYATGVMNKANAILVLKHEERSLDLQIHIDEATQTQKDIDAAKSRLQEQIVKNLVELRSKETEMVLWKGGARTKWKNMLDRIKAHGVDVREIENLEDVIKDPKLLATVKAYLECINIVDPITATGKKRQVDIEEQDVEEQGTPAKKVRLQGTELAMDILTKNMLLWGVEYTPYLENGLTIADEVFLCSDPPQQVKSRKGQNWTITSFLRPHEDNMLPYNHILNVGNDRYYCRNHGPFEHKYTLQKMISDKWFEERVLEMDLTSRPGS